MQWVQRVERARAATGWNDDQTMSFVVGALRGAALEWYDTLTRCGVNNMIWDEVRTQFLISYDPARTARTAVVNIFDVKQEAHETICAGARYYHRYYPTVSNQEHASRPEIHYFRKLINFSSFYSLCGLWSVDTVSERLDARFIFQNGDTIYLLQRSGRWSAVYRRRRRRRCSSSWRAAPGHRSSASATSIRRSVFRTRDPNPTDYRRRQPAWTYSNFQTSG